MCGIMVVRPEGRFVLIVEGPQAVPKREDRVVMQLACEVCNSVNYATSKNRRTTTGRLEIRKYCNTCRHHTDHREKR